MLESIRIQLHGLVVNNPGDEEGDILSADVLIKMPTTNAQIVKTIKKMVQDARDVAEKHVVKKRSNPEEGEPRPASPEPDQAG